MTNQVTLSITKPLYNERKVVKKTFRYKQRILYYFLQDTDNQKRSVTPFLISTKNNIDLGTVSGHLLELTQVKEIVITQAYI